MRQALVLLLLLWGPASVLGGAWTWLLLLGQLAMFYLLGWYGLRQRSARMPAPALQIAG